MWYLIEVAAENRDASDRREVNDEVIYFMDLDK